MNLPGLQQLAAISPDLADTAARLGRAAWGNPARTPRETTAAFLGADLALGLFDLPLTLHATMARRQGVSDGFLVDVITRLAPDVGYPQAAQALRAVAPVGPGRELPADEAGDHEIRYGRATAHRLLRGAADEFSDVTVDDILREYGALRSRAR